MHYRMRGRRKVNNLAVKEFDYQELKGRIKGKFELQSDFAVAMGMSPVSLSKKLNNIVPFTQREMNKACEILEIDKEFIPVIFFKEKS